jgi:hypothetical protein
MDWIMEHFITAIIPEKYMPVLTAIAVIIIVADHVAASLGWIKGNSSAQVFYNGIQGFLSGIIKKEGVDLGNLGIQSGPGTDGTSKALTAYVGKPLGQVGNGNTGSGIGAPAVTGQPGPTSTPGGATAADGGQPRDGSGNNATDAALVDEAFENRKAGITQ